MKEGRKPEYPEKTPGDELQRCTVHVAGTHSNQEISKQVSRPITSHTPLIASPVSISVQQLATLHFTPGIMGSTCPTGRVVVLMASRFCQEGMFELCLRDMTW